jgi:hypothetical protein
MHLGARASRMHSKSQPFEHCIWERRHPARMRGETPAFPRLQIQEICSRGKMRNVREMFALPCQTLFIITKKVLQDDE